MMNEAQTSNAPSDLRSDLPSARFGLRLLRRKYVWLALILLALPLLFIGYRIAQEWRAHQANERYLSQLAEAGIPYDNASAQAAYLQRTSPDGYDDWAKIIRLTEWGYASNAYDQLPYIFNGEPPTVLVPDKEASQWANKAVVTGYLDQMEPVIDLIEQASSHPTPVEFPMHFDGFNTLLPHIQHSRSIVRLLRLDCEYAYSQGDTARALRDLSLMRATSKAFDSRDCLVSILVDVAILQMRYDTTRRTLTHCAWRQSELTDLRDSLSGNDDVAARWREAFINERSFVLAFLEELPWWAEGKDLSIVERSEGLLALPSDRQFLTQCHDEMLLAASGSMLQWKTRAGALAERLQAHHSDSLAGLLLPACEQVIGAGINAEHHRRWTLTAVALQQFRQQHDAWPEQLSDLQKVGVVLDDYSNVYGEMFGYEVDGEKAYLWISDESYEGDDAGRVPSTRPTEVEAGKSLDSYVLELR